MSSHQQNTIVNEAPLFTVPDWTRLLPKVDEIVVRSGVFEEITVGALTVTSLNGTPIAGSIVSADGAALLKNKQMEDETTTIVDATDNTIALKFDVGGTTNTTLTIATAQSADRTITIPDSTADEFVMNDGDQTIAGQKTFTDGITTETLTVYTINGNGGLVFGTSPVNFGTSEVVYHSMGGITTTTTPANFGAVLTTTNTAYWFHITVIGARSTGSFYVTEFYIRVVNVAGTLTVGSMKQKITEADSDVSTCSVSTNTLGTIFRVACTGIAARMSWSVHITATKSAINL